MLSPRTSITESRRLPSLDGLRAVSILMVVASHARGTLTVDRFSVSTLLGLIGTGGIGVSIFFVISGFLITTLLLREHSATGSIRLKNFYIRRAFRIFPAFYAYWLVALGLTALGAIRLSHSELIGSALYVWNYMPRTTDTWFLGHTWSLSVEEQFYLLWPLALKLLGPEGGRWIAQGVLLISPFVRVASYFVFPSVRPRIGMMLHTRADTLLIGALLAILCLHTDYVQKIGRWARSSFIPIYFVLFLSLDRMLAVRFRGAYLLSAGYVLQNLMIVWLLAHVVFHARTWLGRTLNLPAVVHLGVVSYSLYLWQQLFLTPKNTTLSGIFPWNIACAFVMAELSYRFLERPFLGWRERFTNHPESRPSADPAPKLKAASASASASA